MSTRLEAVAGYDEDPAIRVRVDLHLEKVRELATVTLLYLDPGQTLSSVGTRVRQTSMGTLICSRLRDCLAAHACVFNGGGIRASREYTSRLTYADIEAEVPFDNEVVVVSMPGSVLAASLAASRARAPAEWGAFLQVDDRMTVNEAHELIAVDGAPLDPDRIYDVALIREILFGLDHLEPLVTWSKANPAVLPPAGSGREPKVLLVQAFALAVWKTLGGFDVLDSDRDEKVTSAEIAAAVHRRHPSQGPSKVLADLIIQAIDVDADRIVSRRDAAEAALLAKKH